MIVFDLACHKGHVFETWFADTKTFERLRKKGHVACAECGSTKVDKALMAPRVRGGKKKDAAPPPEKVTTDPKAVEMLKALRELRRQVETNAEYVGPRFADEARKIHYEETPKRNIYGEANEADAKSLAEEGIEVARIPWVPREDA